MIHWRDEKGTGVVLVPFFFVNALHLTELPDETDWG